MVFGTMSYAQQLTKISATWEQLTDQNLSGADQFINKNNQEITYDIFPEANFADKTIEIGTITSSGLAVSYPSSNMSVTTFDGLTVSLLTEGTADITANQEGNFMYNVTASSSQTLRQQITLYKSNLL